jgi:predicted RNA-binding Zn-ribbon protein involved in translation (DUF1610 family)
MIIEIEFPFTQEFTSAYKVSSQGRNTVCLYNTTTKKRQSISFARYLMSVHLKRYLNKEEHVDHINNIKNDDRIENLQILSRRDNNIKMAKARGGKKMVEFKCPICGKLFSVRRSNTHLVTTSKKAMTCSRECGGKSGKIKDENFIKIIMLREYNI